MIRLFIFIFSINILNAQSIEWISFEEALELQKETPKNTYGCLY